MAMVLRNRKRSRDLPSEEGPPVVSKKRVAKKQVSTINIASPFTDKEHFLKSCMKMQTESEMLLDFWDMKVARIFYGPYERIYNVSVNTKDMKKRLRSECTTAFEQLKTKLRGKMFSLKLETVPKDWRFIGVSVQFMENFDVKIAHLGKLDTRTEYESGPEECGNCGEYGHSPFSADRRDPNYRDGLKEVLEVAGLYFHQIYSTTSSYDFTSDSDSDWDYDGQDRDCFLPYSRAAFSEIFGGISQWLQPYRKDLVMLEKLGIGPTFTKLSELKKEKCDGRTKLTSEQLILVNKLWRALKPFEDMVKNVIKSKQYTCGDLMLDLQGCVSELEKHNDGASTTLMEKIEEGMAKLLKNIQFLAALYLDPRFNNRNNDYLTEDEKGRVLRHLDEVYTEIEKVEQRSADDYDRKWDFGWDKEPLWSEVSGDGDDEDDYGDDRDESDKVLSKESKVLQNALKKLESQPEPSPDFNIAKYWQAKKNAKLKKLANVVLAYPVFRGPIRGNFDFDPKILTSNTEEDLKNLMKMHIGYTTDM